MKDHLRSIRAVINSSNEVISVYDYDAWGYKLREWKSGDDAKYRFTGKERDNETGYDYFGARYYDSRIGRWGGMEPKYDKYIGLSPYSYAYSNSLKIIDVDGKDGKIVVDNSAKTITIYNVNLYTKNEKYSAFALSNIKEQRLTDYVNQANEQYNEASKDHLYYGYSVKFVFKKVETKSNPYLWNKEFGMNVAISEKGTKKSVPAGIDGSTLKIFDTGNQAGTDAKRTGSHELGGHQLGLPDLYQGDKNVMFWEDKGQTDPTWQNVVDILDNAHLNLSGDDCKIVTSATRAGKAK
ncbi:MAG: RHS repeat-associated core domain-containing protein [Ignavibacteria bacterium]|nr:RHS repeat-associated core domain-containing protein [Ignavibacteria bacterium]